MTVQIIRILETQQKEMSEFTTLLKFSYVFKYSKILNASTEALGMHKGSFYCKPRKKIYHK